MNSFFIYTYKYREQGIPKHTSVTVIFCSSEEIDEKDLQSEIKKFYESHYQTDEVYAIGSSKIIERLLEVFITNQDKTFKGIPKRQETFLSDSLFVLSFDKDGKVTCENSKSFSKGFEESFKNEGLQKIFISRGGLIVSEASHHYVFPSGKHCDRFLRTGNILLYSPEIYFIAFALLMHYNEEEYSKIYCDTSSINSVAFALFDLKNNFLKNKRKISIESFSSYEGLYKNPESYTRDSFLLVSASTSANIIKYILDKHKVIERDNIVILYFLAGEMEYSNVKDQILCNLTKTSSNENGIPFYPTYNAKDCEFCKRGSYAVPVAGDVFLLEKPKINRILLSVTDREKNLSTFVHQFMSKKKECSVFKVHYKERSTNKYEVYIDYSQILRDIDSNPRYHKYRNKLNDHINQFIPTNTKYLLALNDDASKHLSNYIFNKIEPYYNESSVPTLLDQDSLQEIDPEKTGTVVVVGSCIANGKNLLYISRALRKFDNLRIVYFVGIARTCNKEYLVNLKSSLKRGRYGGETNSFIEIDTIFCSNSSKNSTWMVEVSFLKDIILFLNDNYPDYEESIKYFERRRKKIEEYSGDEKRGMNESLYYDRIATIPSETLSLRKNFAFFDFDDYDSDVTQSDVYFTISNIMNSLRNSDKIEKNLKQAVYVRNIMDPGNFDRFNDGIIQASILRSAKAEELAYSIDAGLSQEMYNTLETIVGYYDQEQGEALLEFLYALSIKKLSLSVEHLEALLRRIRIKCKEEVFQSFAKYIQHKLVDEPAKLKNTPLPSK